MLTGCPSLLGPHFKYSQERFLRDLHAADALHALLAFLLLLEQLALARDVPAVALREDVLAQRLDRVARDDAAADGRLDRDLEHLPWDELAHLRGQRASARIRHVAMDDRRQRVDRLLVDQNIELYER